MAHCDAISLFVILLLNTLTIFLQPQKLYIGLSNKIFLANFGVVVVGVCDITHPPPPLPQNSNMILELETCSLSNFGVVVMVGGGGGLGHHITSPHHHHLKTKKSFLHLFCAVTGVPVAHL